MSCLVTGCALVFVGSEGKPAYQAWGDMHGHDGLPGCLIFNAALRDGQVVYEEPDARGEVREYYIRTHGTEWSRRGVFVLDARTVGWNAAVGEYLGLSELSRDPR